MCLTEEFFLGHEQRIKNWKTNGLSILEATSNLNCFHTTIYPVATEVAEFIYENWTLKEINELPESAKAILFEIIEPHKIKASNYLDFISFDYSISRPFTLIEDIPFIELLERATIAGTAKDIYKRCLSILFLIDSSTFEATAHEINATLTDRIFLGYTEEEILTGKNRPSDKEGRDPIQLLVGKPRYTFARLDNHTKVIFIEKLFNSVFRAQNIIFSETAFAKSLTKKLEAMTRDQAHRLLDGLL